ncbi:MAG TPA: hypothetical protein VEN30_01895 [Paraburkholderia sp.]|nr:hypothetical protein [Paraburkholderia sp.]
MSALAVAIQPISKNQKMHRQIFFCPALLAACVCLAISGCAPAIPVRDAQLVASASSQQVPTILTVQQDITIRLSSGYGRKILAQSRWRVVGNLPEGRVLKPVGSVFTVEGRQVHEAYLVVADGSLVGFYLPGEAHFSPLDKPLPLTLGEL